MAVRKIKNAWWVDFRADYVRYRRRSPENSRAGALAYEATLRQKLVRGEPIDKASDTVRQQQTFTQFARQWFDHYVVPNNKPSEQRAKRSVLNSSLIPFFGSMPLRGITSYHIEKYKASTLKEGVSRKTINNRLTILRKCLTTAYEWLEIKEGPPKITWLKCPPPKTDYLSLGECCVLLSNSEGVLYELILAALRTGMRQGELKGLQWSSIDWQNKSIAVRHTRYDYTKELGSPKNNRERHIPMDADLHSVLLRRKQDSGYVFVNSVSKPFNSSCLERQLAALCKKVNLRKIGWHTLRHTFASHLAMNGVPLNVVQALLGHSTIQMTMRYAHLMPSTLRLAIDMLNPKTASGACFGQHMGNKWTDALQQETQRACPTRTDEQICCAADGT